MSANVEIKQLYTYTIFIDKLIKKITARISKIKYYFNF